MSHGIVHELVVKNGKIVRNVNLVTNVKNGVKTVKGHINKKKIRMTRKLRR